MFTLHSQTQTLAVFWLLQLAKALQKLIRCKQKLCKKAIQQNLSDPFVTYPEAKYQYLLTYFVKLSS